jgi:ferric-dicitrate binding protein FerR (iron transport regulator)
MLILFHQYENEFELKGLLLNELEQTEVKETSSSPFKDLFKKLWEKIEKRQHKQKSNLKNIKILGGIAAAVLIGLLFGIYVSSIKIDQKAVYYTSYSPKGSISEIILPDSSIIILNADSEIKYSYNGEGGIREVFLNGEAWFNVQKINKKPYIVHTACYDINVTGTQFNVKSYEVDNNVTTTLEEGEVIITGTKQFNLAENIRLLPGEQAILDRSTNKLIVKEVNTKWFTSWKDNKLIFVNTEMKDVVALLERRYGFDIEVRNSEILGLHYVGTFENKTIIEVLEIIKKQLPIEYKIIDQKIIITTTN